MILPQTIREEAVKLAEKLRRRIQKYEFGITQKVAVSVGVTTSKPDDEIEKTVS